MRGRREIKKVAGPSWSLIALDREKWAPLEEAFTNHLGTLFKFLFNRLAIKVTTKMNIANKGFAI